MRQVYVGLDVSDKSTQVCVVDDDGKVIWSGVCPTCPDAIAKALGRRAPGVTRVVLETDYSKTLEDADLGKRED